MRRLVAFVVALCLSASTAQAGDKEKNPKEMVRQFIESIRNPDPYVRSEAGISLGMVDFRPYAEQLIEPVVRSLKDPDQTVRRNAAWFVEQLGPIAKDAVPALIEMLEEQEISSRVNAAGALMAIGPDAKKAIPELVKSTNDKIPMVRVSSCNALSAIGIANEECIDALLARSNDPDTEVRQAVVRALWRLNSPNPKVHECLRNRMKDSVQSIRREALQASRALKMDAKDFIPALKDAMQDSAFDVRDLAGLTLTDFGVDSLPILKEMSSHRSIDVRVRAVWAIGFMHAKSKAAVPNLVELLAKDPEARVRSQAAAALGAIGESLDEVIPVLKKALKDDDKQVRVRVQEALDLIESRKKIAEPKK